MLAARCARSRSMSAPRPAPPAAHIDDELSTMTATTPTSATAPTDPVALVEVVNVATTASAKIHAFGFSYWKTAACGIESGREISARPATPAPATRYAR